MLQSRVVRNKTKWKTPSPRHSFLPSLNFTPNSSAPPPKWHRGMGNGVYCQFIKLFLCHSFLLMLFSCSRMDSHPWDTVLHELPQCVLRTGCRSSGTAPAYVLSWGTVLQEQSTPVWFPHGATGPLQRVHIPLQWIHHSLQSGYLIHFGPAWATGEVVLWCLEHLLHLYWLWCLHHCFWCIS